MAADRLAYRSPGTPSTLPSLDPAIRLHRFEVRYRLKWIGFALLGIPITLLPAALWATASWERQFIPLESWTSLFMFRATILVPLLVVVAMFSRGSFTQDLAEDVAGSRSTFAMCFTGRFVLLFFLLELFCWGPRLAMHAARTLVNLARHAGADRATAAGILGLLLQHNALPTVELSAQTGSSTESFGRALALLAELELIDISKTGDRIWILTGARERLC
jgi:hypothetical protein